MIDNYGADAVISAIEASVPLAQAQLVVSTAHKAKGLEWSKVRIANDFREPTEPKTGKPLPIQRDEAMLAYVAVTRAMHTLDTGGLAWVHRRLEALSRVADPTGVAVGESPKLDGHQTASVAATAATPGALAFAALDDRTRRRLDAAVLVYRESPTDENLAARLAVHADASMREQTSEFMTRTAPTVPFPAAIEPSPTHDKPDPVAALEPVAASGAAVAGAPPPGPDAPARRTPDDLLARYGLTLG
jgi:ATP-dependent exoDNAse (exonuclease V) beta subunit